MDRRQQISRILGAALAQPSSEHDAFLDAVCEGDQDLQREVRSLLTSSTPPDAAEAETRLSLARVACRVSV